MVNAYEVFGHIHTYTYTFTHTCETMFVGIACLRLPIWVYIAVHFYPVICVCVYSPCFLCACVYMCVFTLFSVCVYVCVFTLFSVCVCLPCFLCVLQWFTLNDVKSGRVHLVLEWLPKVSDPDRLEQVSPVLTLSVAVLEQPFQLQYTGLD